MMLPHSADMIDGDDLAHMTTLATCSPMSLSESLAHHERVIGAALDTAHMLWVDGHERPLEHLPLHTLIDAASSVVCGVEYFLAIHTRLEA